ncbi:cellulose synthase/poly-beta-1,6-N-acetylglucosamine synthase-like glycosyltransferase [Lacibacter cauensis]|uniref:Cellulose synthase/poly-beta-1,6-N-acetylglucosamine synthase-like glycosyltransferase n=1 Tax=Lacibacter cauensis TaxID=510947 RepID=A0A562SPD2_9BACT|nr:glycosyltransferase [Lacibacter cauensis]TWI83149.1 cellulose synthase/poly-beta-1,6-N-acetylglucosamine synthase-like glycosyltransferase [Lacibacter cauensis]
MLWLLLTCCLLLPYTVLLLLYRYWWSKTKTVTVNRTFQPSTRFSIIIPARNEEQNINACLQSIAQLNYPNELFEVIVMDDFSTDATVATAQQFPFVKVLELKTLLNEKINSYKKKAIELGIVASTGDYIVTTDADCIVPENWLYNFAFIIQQKPTVFIAAPVAMKEERSAIKVFQSLDFLSLQGITAASVGAGFHSMCNGANLCYSKEAFYKVDGFKGVDHIASGDDMLLMHKLYNQYPNEVHYCKAADSIVLTEPVETVAAFFRQRIRWASKADKYDDKRIFVVLLLVYLLNVWLLVLAISCFFISNNLQLLLLALGIKTIAELFFLFPVARFFQKQQLLVWFPLAQPFHIVYTVIAGWLGKFGNYEWKGRTVR